MPRLVTIPLNKNFNPKFSKLVTNRSCINEKTGQYTDDGVFSERIFGKMSIDTTEYACNCRILNDKSLKGIQCPACNSVVRLQNNTFAKTGWIHFENNGQEFHLLSPVFYLMFAKIIGKTELQKILQFGVKLDVNGNVIRDPAQKKYHMLGLYQFQQRWREVLDFYFKPDKHASVYAFILRNADQLFTSMIPVFPVALRPAVIADKTVKFAEVNNFYNYMVGESQNLKMLTGEMLTEYTINHIMWRVQIHANQTFNYIIEAIGGKKKYLRNQIFGTRVNFGARNVISPNNPLVPINHIALPYLTCMELYKFEIIHMYRSLVGCSILQANSAWHQACAAPEKRFLKLIQELIAQAKVKFGLPGLPVLINRNPTLQLGSIQRVIVSEVKEDFTDLTMSIHNCILSLLGADYDGDVLAIIKLPDLYFYNAFEIFDPACSLIVSRDLPELAHALHLTKEHGLGMLLLTEV